MCLLCASVRRYNFASAYFLKYTIVASAVGSKHGEVFCGFQVCMLICSSKAWLFSYNKPSPVSGDPRVTSVLPSRSLLS